MFILSPLEQFQILSLITIKIFGFDFSITNALLVNILTLLCFSGMIYFFSSNENCFNESFLFYIFNFNRYQLIFNFNRCQLIFESIYNVVSQLVFNFLDYIKKNLLFNASFFLVCDSPDFWELRLQDPASSIMEGILWFNKYFIVFVVVILIVILTGWLLFNKHLVLKMNITPNQLEHQNFHRQSGGNKRPNGCKSLPNCRLVQVYSERVHDRLPEKFKKDRSPDEMSWICWKLWSTSSEEPRAISFPFYSSKPQNSCTCHVPSLERIRSFEEQRQAANIISRSMPKGKKPWFNSYKKPKNP